MQPVKKRQGWDAGQRVGVANTSCAGEAGRRDACRVASMGARADVTTGGRTFSSESLFAGRLNDSRVRSMGWVPTNG